jgi:hypothetical protein
VPPATAAVAAATTAAEAATAPKATVAAAEAATTKGAPAAKRPAATTKRPTATAKRPTTAAKRPTTAVTATAERPGSGRLTAAMTAATERAAATEGAAAAERPRPGGLTTADTARAFTGDVNRPNPAGAAGPRTGGRKVSAALAERPAWLGRGTLPRGRLMGWRLWNRATTVRRGLRLRDVQRLLRHHSLRCQQVRHLDFRWA